MPFNPNNATNPITRTLVTSSAYDLQDIDHDAIVQQINTNINAIEKNAADISTANTKIVNNTTAIEKNAGDISTANTKIVNNTTAIEKNAADISTANTKIVNNTTAIEKNAANIAKISVDPLKIYPIGSIYLSVSETSPETLFGGTWEQIKDMFLLTAGDTYSAGSTGGSSTHTPAGTISGHTLTIDEIPSHTHDMDGNSWNWGDQKGDVHIEVPAVGGATPASSNYLYTNQSTWNKTNATGGGNAHTHDFTGTEADTMPPYLAVYAWKRTA